MKTVAGDSNPIARALAGEATRPVPIWLMRQAGRYLPEYRALREKAGSFWTLCNTPALAAEVTLQPIKRFDLDAAIIFSDILTVPAAVGQQVRMEERVGPQLAPFPGVDKLIADDARIGASLRPVYEALGAVRAELAPAKALIGFAGAPWTLATYMLGANGSPVERHACARKHPELPALLAHLVAVVARHLAQQVQAGADVVQIFDSWAGGLEDHEFADNVIGPTRALVAQLRAAAPNARVIGFPRGVTPSQYKSYAEQTGVDGLSLDTSVQLDWAVRELANKVYIQGNLDPQLLVAGGEILDQGVDSILDAVHGVPFIFNLGHGVVPETPPENVARLVSRVRNRTAS